MFHGYSSVQKTEKNKPLTKQTHRQHETHNSGVLPSISFTLQPPHPRGEKRITGDKETIESL